MSLSKNLRAPAVELLESRQFLAADLAIQAAATQGLATSAADTANITLKNTGTTTLSGKVTVTFTATPAAGGAAQNLGTKQVTLSNLKPNASKGFSGLTIKAPTGSGKFNITAKISGLGDSNAANNSKSAGSVTLKGGANNGGGADTGESIFGIIGAGTKLKFKKTGNPIGQLPLGALNEEGTFTDGNGHSGKYYFTLGPTQVGNVKEVQVLDIDFDSSPGFDGGQRRYHLTFTPFSKRLSGGLNGKTLTFTKSAAGTSAKAEVFSTFLPNVYLKY